MEIFFKEKLKNLKRGSLLKNHQKFFNQRREKKNMKRLVSTKQRVMFIIQIIILATSLLMIRSGRIYWGAGLLAECGIVYLMVMRYFLKKDDIEWFEWATIDPRDD